MAIWKHYAVKHTEVYITQENHPAGEKIQHVLVQYPFENESLFLILRFLENKSIIKSKDLWCYFYPQNYIGRISNTYILVVEILAATKLTL